MEQPSTENEEIPGALNYLQKIYNSYIYNGELPSADILNYFNKHYSNLCGFRIFSEGSEKDEFLYPEFTTEVNVQHNQGLINTINIALAPIMQNLFKNQNYNKIDDDCMLSIAQYFSKYESPINGVNPEILLLNLAKYAFTNSLVDQLSNLITANFFSIDKKSSEEFQITFDQIIKSQNEYELANNIDKIIKPIKDTSDLFLKASAKNWLLDFITNHYNPTITQADLVRHAGSQQVLFQVAQKNSNAISRILKEIEKM